MAAEDVKFLLATIGTVAVLCAVLYGVRRAISSQAWRDVLGIAMTFIVLSGVGFVMIVAEHSLG
jgi:hypothetical protein